MATSQNDIDKVETIKNSGVDELRIDGKRLVYRSLDDLNRIIQDGQDALAAAAGNAPTRTVRAYSTKGV